ncbi:hypothetical protein [Kribbella endophytica]
MDYTDALTLIAAITAAAALIHYWKQVLVALLISLVTIFCFGIFQLVSIIEIS